MTAITAHGISITPPAGWDVRISRRAADAAERTHAVLHAGTFRLPVGAGDYGDGLVQTMRASDVFVALVDFGATAASKRLFAAPGMPRVLRGDDASRSTLQHAMAGQGGVQRFFHERGRGWCLYVVLGSHDQRERLLRRANQVLAAITIEETVSP